MILRRRHIIDAGTPHQARGKRPAADFADRHPGGRDRPAQPPVPVRLFPYGAPSLSAEGQEVVRLQELLRQASLLTRPGQAAGEQQMTEPLIGGLSEADGATLRRVITAVARNPQATDALSDLASAGQLSGLIEHARQVRGLQRLKAVVEDPGSGAADLHHVLSEEWWTLGGRYIAAELLPAIPGLDDLDLPVRRYDNVLHLVKLRAANLPDLVVKDGDHYLAGPQIHEAVAQAMNTLRELDRNSDAISLSLQTDCHRSFATVVIGDPRYLVPARQEAAAQSLRTYNSHLARVDVITWDDLVGGAELSLAMSPELVIEPETFPGP